MPQLLTRATPALRWYRCLAMSVAFCLAAGCATPPRIASDKVADTAPDNGALLLVSLADGSIVGQRIDSAADICMKANDSPATTCLTRGTPLLDTTGQAVIGYHMEQTEIELLAR